MPKCNLQVFFSFIHLFVSYSIYNKTQHIASHKGEKNSVRLAPNLTKPECDITASCISHLHLIITVEMACFVRSLDLSPILL